MMTYNPILTHLEEKTTLIAAILKWLTIVME